MSVWQRASSACVRTSSRILSPHDYSQDMVFQNISTCKFFTLPFQIREIFQRVSLSVVTPMLWGLKGLPASVGFTRCTKRVSRCSVIPYTTVPSSARQACNSIHPISLSLSLARFPSL